MGTVAESVEVQGAGPLLQTDTSRVAATLKPSSDSNIQFEVWMPSAGWNGKFQGIGNGGFAGTISFSGLGTALSHGYATASTDTGHHAGVTDGACPILG